MKRYDEHCRTISVVPAVAQAGDEEKIQTRTNILERLTLAGRQKAWGTPFPIDGDSN